MSEGLVGFGHAVHLVLLLNGVAFVLGGEEELGGELLGHRLALLLAGGPDEPTERERRAAVLRDFARDLIVGAANSARTHLHQGRDIAERRFKRLKRICTPLLNSRESIVDDGARRILLPAPHHRIDKTSERLRTVFKVRTPHALLLQRSTHTLNKHEARNPKHETNSKH